MFDPEDEPQCVNDYRHGPIVGIRTTGSRMMPELAEQLGDGGLVEDLELLCADCLSRETA